MVPMGIHIIIAKLNEEEIAVTFRILGLGFRLWLFLRAKLLCRFSFGKQAAQLDRKCAMGLHLGRKLPRNSCMENQCIVRNVLRLSL